MHHPHRAPCSIGLRLAVAAAFACAAGAASAEPKYVGWAKVEACREIRELKEKLREGGQLDDTARQFIEDTALPQLALDDNRSLIERTRKRIRELLLGDVRDANAHAAIADTIAAFMAALAGDEQAEPVVRVNAMLLVGELRSKDGKPLPSAAPALAAAAGDRGLPAAVRIAALAGVAKHVATGGGDEAAAKTFAPPVTGILTEPVDPARAVEHDWLVSRALQILPQLVRPASPSVAAAVVALLGDAARSIDLRVRAAAALGATTDAGSGVDAAAAVETIRTLAVTALEAEEKAAEARRFEDQYRRGGGAPNAFPAMPGTPPPGMGFDAMTAPPVDPLATPEQACRRAAWRLHTLGAAILSPDGKQGLALLMGDAAEPAKTLAGQLVKEGLAIDGRPEEDALLAALDGLRPRAAGDAPARRPARPAADEPPTDGAQPDADPNASPFDSPFK